jgi:hypothetical protein
VPTALGACAADTPRARHLGGTWAGVDSVSVSSFGKPSHRDSYASTRARRHARPQLRSHVGWRVLERSRAARQALERGTWAHLGFPSFSTAAPLTRPRALPSQNSYPWRRRTHRRLRPRRRRTKRTQHAHMTMAQKTPHWPQCSGHTRCENALGILSLSLFPPCAVKLSSMCHVQGAGTKRKLAVEDGGDNKPPEKRTHGADGAEAGSAEEEVNAHAPESSMASEEAEETAHVDAENALVALKAQLDDAKAERDLALAERDKANVDLRIATEGFHILNVTSLRLQESKIADAVAAAKEAATSAHRVEMAAAAAAAEREKVAAVKAAREEAMDEEREAAAKMAHILTAEANKRADTAVAEKGAIEAQMEKERFAAAQQLDNERAAAAAATAEKMASEHAAALNAAYKAAETEKAVLVKDIAHARAELGAAKKRWDDAQKQLEDERAAAVKAAAESSEEKEALESALESAREGADQVANERATARLDADEKGAELMAAKALAAADKATIASLAAAKAQAEQRTATAEKAAADAAAKLQTANDKVKNAERKADQIKGLAERHQLESKIAHDKAEKEAIAAASAKKRLEAVEAAAQAAAVKAQEDLQHLLTFLTQICSALGISAVDPAKLEQLVMQQLAALQTVCLQMGMDLTAISAGAADLAQITALVQNAKRNFGFQVLRAEMAAHGIPAALPVAAREQGERAPAASSPSNEFLESFEVFTEDAEAFAKWKQFERHRETLKATRSLGFLSYLKTDAPNCLVLTPAWQKRLPKHKFKEAAAFVLQAIKEYNDRGGGRSPRG